jgi:2',3'-cyclic-nucleotide 2'-phosphodiesterase (5'-nucleotidase family)
MVEALTRMGYDAAVLGNHDFLDGPQSLLDMLGFAPRVPLLAANINTEDFASGARLRNALPPYQIFRYGDLVVGVIGLTTFEFTYASYLEPVKITDPVPAATYLAQTMHSQGVQAIVLLSHNSFEYNKTLARQVPWVTAVISGHSHVKTPAPAFVTNAGRQVAVVEAGYWGRFLGELNFDVQPKSGTVRFVSYMLNPVTPLTAEHQAMKTFVEGLENQVRDRFNRDVYADTVATTTDLYPHTEDRESILSNFLTEAYRTALGTDAAFDIASLQGLGIAPGPLSTVDVYNLMPHIPHRLTGRTWTLKRLTLTGRELEVILNLWLGIENYDIPLTGHLSMAGVRMTAMADGLNPVRELLIGGTPLEAARDYTIALHDGFLLILNLANDRVHMGLDLSRVEDSGVEAWKSAAQLLYTTGTFNAAHYAPGQNLRYLSPDLEWRTHAARWERRGSSVYMAVPVRNAGLVPTTAPVAVVVKAGPNNDFVNEGTPMERLTDVSTGITVPPLAAGEETLVEVTWTSPSALAGVQAVQFSFSNNAGDGNRANDKMRLYVTKPGAAARAARLSTL